MGTNEHSRRNFLRTSILGSTGAFFASSSLASTTRGLNRSKVDDKPIIKRTLGKTGIELPIVNLGALKAENPALVRAAIKEGMVFFDTAHSYQNGRNEGMLGEVLKDYPRNSFVIATKVMTNEKGESAGTLGDGSTRKTFLEKFDISLKRLHMEYVDILFVHDVRSRDVALHPEILDAVTTAKQSGKAKHVAISAHMKGPEILQAAIDSGIYEVVLTSVNFKQDNYAEVKKAIAAAVKAGLGVVAMKTMAGGFHDKARTRPINGTAALKFVLQDENVTTAIPWVTTFDQLMMNASVNRDLTMTAEEQADLAIGHSEGGLYCQGCEHCVKNCPKRLPIPELMRAYMYAYGYRDSQQAHALLTSLNVSANPCGDCSHCSAVCKKKFDVSERITDIMRIISVPEEFLS